MLNFWGVFRKEVDDFLKNFSHSCSRSTFRIQGGLVLLTVFEEIRMEETFSNSFFLADAFLHTFWRVQNFFFKCAMSMCFLASGKLTG